MARPCFKFGYRHSLVSIILNSLFKEQVSAAAFEMGKYSYMFLPGKFEVSMCLDPQSSEERKIQDGGYEPLS